MFSKALFIGYNEAFVVIVLSPVKETAVTAGIWAFLFSLLAGPFRRRPAEPPLPAPETLLQQAQQEMREGQAKNRERAVQAITQKNNLQAELDKTRRTVQRLESQAEAAANDGDFEKAQQFQTEAEIYAPILLVIEGALERATKTMEAIKEAIRREEQRIRARTAQAMALTTQVRDGQITASVGREAPDPRPRPKLAEETLDVVLKQMERTRDVLWSDAQTALEAGDYTAAIRLLDARQSLDTAVVFGRTR